MIIGDKHGYVFIEVPHTGSTAVSRELRENYEGERILRKHATYRDFLRAATPEQKAYFSFAAVRNPLDLAVSRYFRLKTQMKDARLRDPAWLGAHGSLAQKMEFRVQKWIERNDASFEQFLLRWYRLPYDTWTSLDHKRLSRVMRFESLTEDFDAALRGIGIDPVRPLPAANVTQGRDKDFVTYYTPRAIRRAVWVFGPYMRQWGYEFPTEWGEVKVPFWSTPAMRTLRVGRSVYWKFLRFRSIRRPTEQSASPFYTPTPAPDATPSVAVADSAHVGPEEGR